MSHTGWEAVSPDSLGQSDTYIHYTHGKLDWIATNRSNFDAAFDDACAWFGEPLDCGVWKNDHELPPHLPLGEGYFAATLRTQEPCR